ncbi:helix-turn-helix domain-containing protein [Myroides pelagicus]|nr:helix-turn-helix domain-containing protein [Myroides pelagicus]MEC4115311.1 helix-turn-helix domain-containing protein [Myroides pelagicus]
MKSRDYNIYEVAEYVGYKHSHHFSTAFKKYFGQLPTQVIV